MGPLVGTSFTEQITIISDNNPITGFYTFSNTGTMGVMSDIDVTIDFFPSQNYGYYNEKVH